MHIIYKITLDLDQSGVKYCHFKSNEHLQESYQGICDFDVLANPKTKKTIDKILINNDCKRFEPEYLGYYPGVENWLAFDTNTGVIFHIHLHYQLITGKKLVKDYVLPWRDIILNNSIKPKYWKINIADPHFEIFLLLSRIVVKSKIRDLLKAVFSIYKLEEDMQIEYKYLKRLINEKRINCTAKNMFSIKTEQKLADFVINNDEITSKGILYLNKILRKEFKNYRRYNSFISNFKSIFKRSADLKNKFLSRKMNMLHLTKKVSTSGGSIISFVGVDGCGKSTVSEEITNWLGKKIECRKFYMGVGDGKKNFFATSINLIKKINDNKNKKVNPKKQFNENFEVSFKKEPKNYLKKFIHALVIYSVVKDNRKKIIKMHKYRLNGGHIILDRYPQLEHENINDGLKLKKYSRLLNNNFLEKLSKKEEKMMEIVEDIYPNIVFKLHISAETSMKRKPEEQTDLNAVERKIDGVSSLEFNNSYLVNIDAEEKFEKELLIIKQQIWECL